MSEETAFLEALKANPADDTARLVYADWLDEHNEHDKAEYLRLVAAVTQFERDYSREQPEVGRLLGLAERLNSEWRTRVGSRFKVVFYEETDPAKFFALIRAVRTATGLGVAETLDAVRHLPSELLACVPFEQAIVARDAIREAGGAVYVHPCERNDRPVAILYHIVAQRSAGSSLSDPVQAAECRRAFALFLKIALNIGDVEARRLAEQERVTIAEYQEPFAASERAGKLQALTPSEPTTTGEDEYPDSQPRWGIRVDLIPTTAPIADS